MGNQMLLALGGMMLLSLISLNLQRHVVDAQEVSYDNEAILTATSIGQSLLQDIAAKQFDEQCIVGNVTSPDSLTAPAYLGPEYGEAAPNFDDIDDYKGDTVTVASGRLGNFKAVVSVWYTSTALQGGVSSVRTYLKAISVRVFGNPALKEDVTLSSIVAY